MRTSRPCAFPGRRWRPAPNGLDVATLLDAVERLSASDSAIASSVRRFGPPPLWSRDPSFASLVHLILEQQVSLASARAAFDRLLRATSADLTPAALLLLDDAALREIGFSRQKAAYARGLATALGDGFALADLDAMGDDEARAALMRLRGIGRWTADIYLAMCLRRPDVWPHGDQALVTGAVELLDLAAGPTFEELEGIAERWRPHRAVAARVVWQHYLRVRGRSV
jgi:DNA-3-methyladenine glycosylase II